MMTEQEEFQFRARLESEMAQRTPKKSIYEQQAQSGTGFDNLLPAVGGNIMGTYLGGKQMVMQALDKIDPKGRAAAMEPEIQENRDAMDGLKTTKMGMAGDVGGSLLTLAPTMLNPLAATLRGAAVIGAGTGAFRPTIGNESRIENTLAGAALGAGAFGGGGGASSATSSVTPNFYSQMNRFGTPNY